MKNKVLKMIRTISFVVIALAIITVGTFDSTVDTSAAKLAGEDTVTGVKYVQYENMDYSEYWGTKAPEFTEVDASGVGYLFAGWYSKVTDENYDVIETDTDLATAKTNGTVVAKFVPARTMSVKCQNWAGTTAESDAVIRIISATDSKNFSTFGFVVTKIVGTTETLLADFQVDTVYRTFKYYDSVDDADPTSYAASDLFGTAAKYFTTCTVGTIPSAHHGTIICIKPYWKTLDGVTVYGLSKFAHVEDGYLGYVNVPVNLNVLTDNNGAAAGLLSVKSNDGLEFLGAEEGVEFGKVFDEMDFNVFNDGTIRCIGNTSDISDKNEMDVFVNLKFKRADVDKEAPIVNYTFTVGEEEFINSNEEDLTYKDVWNVVY